MDPATTGLGVALLVAGLVVTAGLVGRLVIAILNRQHNLRTRIELLEQQRKAETEVIAVLGQLAEDAPENPAAPDHPPDRAPDGMPKHPSQRDIDMSRSTPSHLRLITYQDACHDTRPETGPDTGTNITPGNAPRSPGKDTTAPTFCPDRAGCGLL